MVLDHESSYWPLDTNRFGRIVITDTQNLPSSATVNYADYTLALNELIDSRPEQSSGALEPDLVLQQHRRDDVHTGRSDD